MSDERKIAGCRVRESHMTTSRALHPSIWSTPLCMWSALTGLRVTNHTFKKKVEEMNLKVRVGRHSGKLEAGSSSSRQI